MSELGLRARVILAMLGVAALGSCSSSNAPWVCGSPAELTNLAEQVQWERAIREDVFAAMSAAHPDPEYQRLTLEIDRISQRLSGMADQYGVSDDGGWCDEDCQRRSEAFGRASAELRDQLAQITLQHANRRTENERLFAEQLQNEVAITAHDASTLSADEAPRSALCEAHLSIAVGDATQFERVVTYRSTENGVVEVLAVRADQ